MSKTYVFDVHSRGDDAAGLPGYTEKVTVVLDSGKPLGETGDFEDHLRRCLGEWFDGATVALSANASPRITEVMDQIFALFEEHGVGPGGSLPVKTIWMALASRGVKGEELQAALDHGVEAGAWKLNPGGTTLTLTDAGYAQSRS